MSSIKTAAINHLALTVTDMDRARDFYRDVLGFEFVTEFGPKYLMSNGEVILALNQAPDPAQAIENDRFSEHRVGLDHVSFNVGTMAELENALQVLEDMGVPHGEIKDLGGLGISVLAFRDPDNIQVELTTANT